EPAPAGETLVPDTDPGCPGEGTQAGQVVGTPGYMSPEQAAGCWDRVGPASDIYSLGATLYALLTGRPPLQEVNWTAVLAQGRRGVFLPPRQVKRNVPRALEAVCLKAMAFAPEERYATALELAAEVEQWLADEPVRAYREPWPTRTRRWLKRHRTPVAVVATAVLALVLLGGGAWPWQGAGDAGAGPGREQPR